MAVKNGSGITEGFRTSHWNFNEALTRDFRIPKKVIVHDCTLRDGLQEPGITLSLDDSIHIAEKLAEVGVHRVEIGHGGMNPEEAKTIKEIAKRNLGPEIFTFCGPRAENIDKAIDCGVNGLLIPFFSSEYEVQATGRTKESIVDSTIEATCYAREKGLWVTLFTIDATRSEDSFYFNMVEKIVEDGYFDSICVADTRGVLNPQAVSFFVKRIKEKINRSVEIHVHNNFGLAVANTAAGVIAGCDIIHSTINGVGASAGNCPLSEIAVTLRVLYGIDTGIKHDKLVDLTRFGARLLGRPIPPMRPLVGDMIYAVEVERIAALQRSAEQQGKEFDILNEYPVKPEFVGHKPGQRIMLGANAGRANVEIRAEEMNITLTHDQITAVLAEVKRKGKEVKRVLTEEEFREITDRIKAG